MISAPEQLHVLYDVARRLGTFTDLDELVRYATRKAREAFDAEGCALLLHDLGPDLADRTTTGNVVKSRWRTAPLWGLGHALRVNDATLLHDGRARNVAEAILWHDGQGAAARRAFMQLPATDRQLLLEWVASR